MHIIIILNIDIMQFSIDTNNLQIQTQFCGLSSDVFSFVIDELSTTERIAFMTASKTLFNSITKIDPSYCLMGEIRNLKEIKIFSRYLLSKSIIEDELSINNITILRADAYNSHLGIMQSSLNKILDVYEAWFKRTILSHHPLIVFSNKYERRYILQ